MLRVAGLLLILACLGAMLAPVALAWSQYAVRESSLGVYGPQNIGHGPAWGGVLRFTESPPEITVVENTAEYVFAQRMIFHIEVSGPADITQVVLVYRTSDSPGTSVETLHFSPSPRVRLQFVRDLQTYYLKPFVTVTYWWIIADATGRRVRTTPQALTYADDRFAWETLEAEGLFVHWYQGDLAFGQAALDIAVQAVTEIGSQLGATLPHPTHIYIYATTADLQGALAPYERVWVGGQTFPEIAVTLVSIPPGSQAGPALRRDIPHEITHLLLYQVMGRAFYAHLPNWLNEGLAVANEMRPNPEYDLLVQEALAADQLLPLDVLCGAFGADPQEAMLSYAQSASLVRYIRNRYGNEGIRALVAAYADGTSCRGGVERALGLTLAELEREWQNSLRPRNLWATLFGQNWPWLLLLAVPLALPLLFLGGEEYPNSTTMV